MEKKFKKLGEKPAFANVAFNEAGIFTHIEKQGHFGMSKRFYAACAAMQGILSNTEIMESILRQSKKEEVDVVKAAYEYADELIKQE